MSDIVERLERGVVLSNSPELLKEAAAEIKRLRAVSGKAIEGTSFREVTQEPIAGGYTLIDTGGRPISENVDSYGRKISV